MIGYPDGTNVIEEKMLVSMDNSEGIGAALAQKMIDNGALDLLKNAEKIAFKDEMPQRI